MKLPRTLTISLLALGVTAARAQDIKLNLPGNAPAAAPAPGAAAPAAAPAAQEKFTDAQLLEEFGWFFVNRTPLGEMNLSKEEVASILKGITAALENKDAPYDIQKAGPLMDEMLQRKQRELFAKQSAEMYKQMSPENLAYFAKLKENKKITALPSGLHYEVVQAGTGPFPTPNDNVRVHYTGKLVSGVTFDSSADRNQPAEFVLSEVIPGWTEGLQKANKGAKLKLYIPPYLAYGDRGSQTIPANSVLVFDVELLEINPTQPLPPPGPAASEKK